MSAPSCSVSGCKTPAKARGWCNRHYLRWFHHGDPTFTKLVRGDDHTRFWSKVDQSEPDACWEWVGAATDKGGYGTIWFRGKQWRAPRVAWVLANDASIPDGLVVRHTCDNPPCVNPAHLILGTPQDNDADRVARGRSATGDRNGSRLYPERLARGEANAQYRAGGCRNGHAAERRYTSPSGERICTDCATARVQRYRARKKAAQQ